MELRYMGFDQKQNTRTYKFDGVASGQPTVHFAVTADLALFLANRIGIQEGPTLCAHKLSSSLEPSDTSLVLTNDDLRAHASARSLAEARKAEARRMGPRRRPPVPPPAV
jgi:hypothetical protein